MFSHCMCMVSISTYRIHACVFVCMRLPNRFDEHNLRTAYIPKCLNMQETIRTISSLPWQGEGCTLTMCGEKTDLKRRVWVFVCVATCWQAAEQYKAAMLISAQNTKTHQKTANKGTGEVPHVFISCSVLFVSFSRPWSPSCWWRVLGLLGWWRGKKWQLTLLFFVGFHCCTSTGMSVRLLGANNGKQQTAKWQSAIMSRNESLASNSSLPVLHSKHLHLYKTFSVEKGCEGNLEDSPHLSNRNK